MTLRELRTSQSITIDEVAAVLCIDRAYYSRLELGRHSLSARQLEALRWRYGWEVEAQQPQAEQGRRMSNVSCRSEQLGQAKLLAMMGAAVWDGEIPKDWDDKWKHRALWTKWICAAGRQALRSGAGRSAA